MAEWIEETALIFGGWHCSNCKYYNFSGQRTPFCPYCGKKMKNPSDGGLNASVEFFKKSYRRKNGKDI